MRQRWGSLAAKVVVTASILATLGVVTWQAWHRGSRIPWTTFAEMNADIRAQAVGFCTGHLVYQVILSHGSEGWMLFLDPTRDYAFLVHYPKAEEGTPPDYYATFAVVKGQETIPALHWWPYPSTRSLCDLMYPLPQPAKETA